MSDVSTITFENSLNFFQCCIVILYSLYLHGVEPNDSGDGEDCTVMFGSNHDNLSGNDDIYSTAKKFMIYGIIYG